LTNGLLGSVVPICGRGGGGRDGCVVGVVGGGFYYVVVVGGWHWADDGYGRAGLLVSTLVGEGYR
jgi:hypothetical protein